MDKIYIIFSIILFLLSCYSFFKVFIWHKIAHVKTVKAEVFDKYKLNRPSKYPTSFKQESCVIVFKTKDKKLMFNVSSFSYDNYRIRDKGTLKYRGNKLIMFK